MNSTESHAPKRRRGDDDDEERYMDYSMDHVARVRRAREAAQRQMESFGDASEYDITIIHGELKPEPPVPPTQPALDFEDGGSDQHEEKD